MIIAVVTVFITRITVILLQFCFLLADRTWVVVELLVWLLFIHPCSFVCHLSRMFCG